MSRSYSARGEARQQQARAAAKSAPHVRSKQQRRLVLVLIFVAIAIFIASVALWLGGSGGRDKRPTSQEVTALLAGIPQQGTTLGSPKAPVTLRVFADLECPTVKLFVTSYLPRIIDTWVREGTLKIDYRSLETDTFDEHIFFEQEIAALAAGRQDKMWNFLLTFVHEQGGSGYVTSRFIAGIAAQVPGLKRAQWLHDREDLSLFEGVALGVHAAHVKGFRSTPSFLIGLTDARAKQSVGSRDTASLKQIEASLLQDVDVLREEASRDVPTIDRAGSYERVKELR